MSKHPITLDVPEFTAMGIRVPRFSMRKGELFELRCSPSLNNIEIVSVLEGIVTAATKQGARARVSDPEKMLRIGTMSFLLRRRLAAEVARSTGVSMTQARKACIVSGADPDESVGDQQLLDRALISVAALAQTQDFVLLHTAGLDPTSYCTLRDRIISNKSRESGIVAATIAGHEGLPCWTTSPLHLPPDHIPDSAPE